MKNLLTLLILQITFASIASEKGILIPEVTLISSEKSNQLHSSESMFIFKMIGFLDGQTPRTITYSIDGKTTAVKLNSTDELKLTTTPGFHDFQFFYNNAYYEIYADSLEVKPRYISTYQIRFESSEYPVMVDKPVIYLYPKEETTFNISVNPKGKMAFTYPKYSDSWNGTAFPNGDITINGETFNYLFWEADQNITAELIDPTKGSIVKGNDATFFLTQQLNLFGFNSKEKADFITYWGPKLANNAFNYIYFVVNDEADYFAELSIHPRPDNISRLYILTCPVANPSDFHYLEPQLIEPINRKGFSVLEWGGSVIDINFVKKRLRLL